MSHSLDPDRARGSWPDLGTNCLQKLIMRQATKEHWQAKGKHAERTVACSEVHA